MKTSSGSAADRYAVFGNPIEHSQSPFIHAAFARQTRQAIEYTRVLAPIDGFAAAVQRFADAGGRGCNVTLPFKFEVPALAHRLSERARLAQAANTLSFEPEGWVADNTDGIGLMRDIEGHAGVSLQGKRVLLIGAGGAAAGVLGPLLEACPLEVVVANRTPDHATELIERHRPLAERAEVSLRACGLDDAGSAFDVLINSSASSLAGTAAPVSPAALRPGSLAVDLMYGPPAAGFLAWAEAHGASGRDGLGMLVEQAAEAFAQWRGLRPDTPPVLAALRERLQLKS
jgi:shikimate dehydrogenase